MQNLKKALLENYNISATNIERIEYGLWEKNYKVSTENDTYFAKQFWGTWRLDEKYDEMLRGIKLGQEMRLKGIPAPLHINDKYDNILSKYGKNTYQVNEWINGITYRPGSIPKEVAYSMGRLLGELHLKMNNSFEEKELQSINSGEATITKKEIIDTLDKEEFDGKNEIMSALNRQLSLLENYHNDENIIITSKVGRVYNSYWIEQLLFDETHNVKALIDWTDGAGGSGNLIDDIDTAFFISSFDLDGIINFARGYHDEHHLTKDEWISIIEHSCTRHLDSNWIYQSWLKQSSNRFEHWKTIARKWIAGIEYRYLNKDRIKKEVLFELGFTK